MESGYIPGGLYVLSTWYTKRELALRTALYFVGNMLASATTGPIAFGILRLAGRNGLVYTSDFEMGLTVVVGSGYLC